MQILGLINGRVSGSGRKGGLSAAGQEESEGKGTCEVKRGGRRSGGHTYTLWYAMSNWNARRMSESLCSRGGPSHYAVTKWAHPHVIHAV